MKSWFIVLVFLYSVRSWSSRYRVQHLHAATRKQSYSAWALHSTAKKEINGNSNRNSIEKKTTKKSSSGSNKHKDSNKEGAASSSSSSSSKDTLALRIFSIEVPLSRDPGKDSSKEVHDALLEKISGKLIQYSQRSNEPALGLVTEQIKVVRKSFDGRMRVSKSGQKDTEPRFVYTVDVTLTNTQSKMLRIKFQDGRVEKAPSTVFHPISSSHASSSSSSSPSSLPKAIIVGAGPAGLFSAVVLASNGFNPIIIERGQPVELRGKDIGALFNRRILNRESNLCYGEGGAGTWSDGKLTTRIGKNSGDVRFVLQTLVNHGAPERILVDGKPHLGTDKLVVILRNLRKHLIDQGAEFRFNTKVKDIIIKNDNNDDETKSTGGVVLENGDRIDAEVVVLAVGHSSRALYEMLVARGFKVEPKGIAVGFRVEHPQELINQIQYGEKFATQVENGKGRIPVADYRLVAEVPIDVDNDGCCQESFKDYEKVFYIPENNMDGDGLDTTSAVDSQSTSETQKKKTTATKSCYSFCMCPGGQIVPTSVTPTELCVNGMSFSRRQSKWANSALVVNISPEDMMELGGTGPLRGVEWQQRMERRAANLTLDDLTVPVQRVTDFITGKISTEDEEGNFPKSSYRLGVESAPLHDVYPSYVTQALRNALKDFDKRMPGYITKEALLHGVETRTSSPVQIVRDRETLESVWVSGVYPTGEGAGYAGGIVSASVDGLRVGEIIAKKWLGVESKLTSDGEGRIMKSKFDQY